ncbi:addiction module antidote protein [Pinirhizobacter soli]|uniref:addiction module antidote protein n=1 Tax=Pinirhizobacter soli TaxID=2786953 RepID=UPI002029C33E|nr:addiction module antidote protein [Pinirhizobacter soli]
MATNFTRFDAAEFLDSEEMIAAYLTEALAKNDPAQVITALGTIARARGMTKIAQDTGLGRGTRPSTAC